MPSLYNVISSGTANEVKTYNFISNLYYAGVCTAKLADHNGTPGNWTGVNQRDWVTGTAIPSANVINSSNVTYFYFPPVIGTPSVAETMTGAPTTSLYRFRFTWNNSNYIGIMNNSALNTCNISTQLNGSATNAVSTGSFTTGVTNTGTIDQNYFNFGAATNTTLVMGGFITANASGGDNLTLATSSAITIFGWMYDGAYAKSPPEDITRFNQCFTFGVNWSSPNKHSTVNGGCPSALNNSALRYFVHAYKDIECLSGSYTGGLFLTELLLCFLSTPYRPILGKVDNRVVCMGRGLFDVGKVYKATNVFGRTGDEYWLCIAPLVPSTYAITNWSYGSDISYTGAWGVNEFDWILMRVYTEAD